MKRFPEFTKISFILLLCFLPSVITGQIKPKIVIDSILELKTGIYSTAADFLNNSPSVSNSFRIINDNPDYYINKNEKNDYYLDYYDDSGRRNIVPLEDFWGFCDGNGIFITVEGKPYKLILLGAVSILRYEKIYHKNANSQLFSYILFGYTVTDIHEGTNVFYLLKEDKVLPYKEKFLNQIISENAELHSVYLEKKRKKRWLEKLYFINIFNRLHPLHITEKGVFL